MYGWIQGTKYLKCKGAASCQDHWNGMVEWNGGMEYWNDLNIANA